MLMPVYRNRHSWAWLLICCCLGLVFLVDVPFSGDFVLPVRAQRQKFLNMQHSMTDTHRELLQDVSNSTLGFQKIFVLGLASRTDRRDSMSLAAAYSGLDIEYVDGVTELSDKALPPGGPERGLNEGSIYAWRTHMNVLRKIVEQNITSALVLEDDIDWDIRIKAQLTEFARAARLLVQPLPQTVDQYLDPTYPKPTPDEGYTDFQIGEHAVSEPKDSPYGDLTRWDLLWLGHCGCSFPQASDLNAPLGRIVIANDTTVPEHKHLDMELGNNDLLTQYPAHTRVVSRARVNSCTLAYGISQPGARRFLYELGVHKMSDTNDMMFRYVCDGVDGRQLGTCLTVQPQLFQHHRPEGPRTGFSDINTYDDGYNERATTANIRWSVRLNLPKLISGGTDYVDSFPDAEEQS